ncbi:hypothetical protein SDC9_137099 [bioreactor metagenome]|uniref:Uncharacterized protein n=1 Tax=bioreactor metagenome TaxID=1076179 RepID=A0A645DMG2_9ZZZZ
MTVAEAPAAIDEMFLVCVAKSGEANATENPPAAVAPWFLTVAAMVIVSPGRYCALLLLSTDTIRSGSDRTVNVVLRVLLFSLDSATAPVESAVAVTVTDLLAENWGAV